MRPTDTLSHQIKPDKHNCDNQIPRPILRFYWLLLCSALLGMSSYCLAVEWSLGVNGQPQAGSQPNRYFLRALWPNSCTPQLVSSNRLEPAMGPQQVEKNLVATGTVIHINTATGPEACSPQPTPFNLAVNFPKNLSSNLEVYWYHQDSTEQNPRLIGFKLINTISAQNDIRPASGWWWPEPGSIQNSGPGTGLTVDFQDGLLTLLTQTFNEQGYPEWLLGTAPLKGGISNTDLIKFSQGQTLSGDYQAPTIDNTDNAIHIRFFSASLASVWLESRPGGRQDQTIKLRQLNMVRYFMDPPILEHLLLGRWLVAPEDSPSYARQAKQFRISSLETTKGRAILKRLGGDLIGSCLLPVGKPDSPPIECQIDVQTDQGIEQWVFRSFSTDKMRGRNQHGGRITAFKLNSY